MKKLLYLSIILSSINLTSQNSNQTLVNDTITNLDEVIIKSNTNAQKIYNSESISKRHRHRYEINKEYIPEFEKNGLIFSADSDNGKRMEMLEIPEHKFYLGVQFHPEFNSRPGFPEEAFSAFIKASAN